MKFNNYFEALPLSQAKYFTRMYDKKRYDDWFEGKNRIYIPLKSSFKDEKTVNPKIENMLKKYGWEIINYKDGYAKQINGKNIIKIGKLLKRLFPLDDILLKEFNNDPIRQTSKKEDLLVVISRHPYDIAGMSTDRGWTSCMNLVDGCNKNKVKYDVRGGSIIAYLIKKEDKNINKPIARLLMKPYFIIDKNGNSIEDKSFLIPDKIYGTANKNFTNAVMDWLEQKQGKLEGYFRIANRKIYTDTDREKIVFMSDDANEILNMYHYGRENFERIKEIILKDDFNPNNIFTKYGDSLLYLVIRDWPIELIELLLKKGANPNFFSRNDNINLLTHLTYSVIYINNKHDFKKYKNKVKLLIKYGLDVNYKDEFTKLTTLYDLCKKIRIEIFKYFINDLNVDYNYSVYDKFKLIDLLLLIDVSTITDTTKKYYKIAGMVYEYNVDLYEKIKFLKDKIPNLLNQKTPFNEMTVKELLEKFKDKYSYAVFNQKKQYEEILKN